MVFFDQLVSMSVLRLLGWPREPWSRPLIMFENGNNLKTAVSKVEMSPLTA